MSLGNYGGDCVNQTLGCVDKIYYSIDTAYCDRVDLSCLLIDQICTLKLNLKTCTVDSTTKFSFSLQEKYSYASTISVTLKSDSSIPGFKSIIQMTSKSANENVFRGPTPTSFEFSLTSSCISSQ